MALRETNKAAKRRRIFAAARRQFATHGFEETTIRSIAQEAGVGVGTVHLYAESKQGLLQELWHESTLPILEQALRAASGRPLLAGALALFEPLLRDYAAEPALAKVVIKELPWLEGRAAEQHLPDFVRYLTKLAELVVTDQGRGLIASHVEPNTAAMIFFSLYYSACLELVTPAGPADVERVLDNLRHRLKLVADGWGVRT